MVERLVWELISITKAGVYSLEGSLVGEDNMSGMVYSGSGTDQGNHEVDEQGSALPGYVAYLVLFFQLIVTTVDLLLAGWVVYTIKTTRILHKPHNVFVANLLISGMINAPTFCLISVSMIISFQLEVNYFISCFMLKVAFFTVHVNNMTFVIIAADKAIAITLPFKHRRIMTSGVVVAIVSGAWLLALIPTAIFNADGITDVPEFGACVFKGAAFTEYFLANVMPVIMGSFLAIILNIYLAIVAYQVHKQIEKETRLSADSSSSSQFERVTALKRKQHNMRQNMKPVITLLVVISSNVFIILVYSVLHILGSSSVFYQEFVEYIIIPNSGYLIHLINPLVYGLYFKQVREPMMKCLRRFLRINKVNAVAPQPRSMDVTM